jgi:hypothetical protein
MAIGGDIPKSLQAAVSELPFVVDNVVVNVLNPHGVAIGQVEISIKDDGEETKVAVDMSSLAGEKHRTYFMRRSNA